MKNRWFLFVVVQALGCLWVGVEAARAISIAPAFAADYSFTDLGAVPGLPVP